MLDTSAPHWPLRKDGASGGRFQGNGPRELLFGQKDRWYPSLSLPLSGSARYDTWGSLWLCCCGNLSEDILSSLLSWLRPPAQAPNTTAHKRPLLFSLGTNKIRHHDSCWLKDKSVQEQSPGQDETTQRTRRRRKRKKLYRWRGVGPGLQAKPPSRPWQAAWTECEPQQLEPWEPRRQSTKQHGEQPWRACRPHAGT